MTLLNGLVRTVAPADPLISLADARLQCRVDTWGSPPQNPEDGLLQQYVEAATEELDGINGWLNRALVTQTWLLTLNCFPGRPIKMPLPPLQSITSIKYDDADGVEQTMDSADYRVITDTDPGFVQPIDSWPSTKDQLGAVRIVYVAGYGDPEDVPEIIQQYVRMRVGQYYDSRALSQSGVAGGVIHEVPHVRHSLESIRMRGVFP